MKLNHGAQKIAVCSNSATLQCYSPTTIAVIRQHFVQNHIAITVGLNYTVESL